MRERIIIVFIAVAIGLVVTTLVFFLYQQTKAIPERDNETQRVVANVTPQQEGSILLKVDTPSDESLTNKRSVQVKGTTDAANTIVVSTNQEDVVAEPSKDGKFSVTVDIDAGSNIITTRAITPTGEETKDIRVVTYSTEEF